MGSGVEHLVLSGPLILAVPIAAAAGALTFLSPCVLPLVPGYLSYVTGLAGADLDSGQRRGRVLAGVGLFIAGFSAVFIGLIVLATRAAMSLMLHRRLTREYESRTASSESRTWWASTANLLRRLTGTSTPSWR